MLRSRSRDGGMWAILLCRVSGSFCDAIEYSIDESGRLGGSKGTGKFDSFVNRDCGRDIFLEEDFIPPESQDGPIDPVESLRRIILYHFG